MFKDIDIKFVNKEITPFGGLSLFFKMLEKCGFEQDLQACGLPEQGSNRGYKPRQLIYGLFAGVWCGACKFVHLDLVRYDRVLSKMVGWDPETGNIPNEEPEVFFYHSDHLGSASWITDASGKPIQHLQYLPFGEPYVDQRTSGYNERFTFTGKERDEETGYGYFGARYMDHELMTMWLSVDPMADKYPAISPYAYCAWNPVRLVDPDGREIDPSCKKEWDSQKTYITVKKNSLSSLRDLLSSYSSFFQQNIDELDERIASLDRTLITMSDLEEDPKTIYTLSLTNNNGYVSLITKGDKKGMVSINYSSTSSFVHEVTHAGQYYCNDIGFFLTNGAIAAYDIYDEVHAYKAALAYSLYAYEYDKMSLDQVTPAWIRSRTDSYNDCGNTPINIFSSTETIKNSGIDNLGIYQTYMEIPPQLLMYRH